MLIIGINLILNLHPAGRPGPGIGRTRGCLWWSSSSVHCPHLSQKQGRPSHTAINNYNVTSNNYLTSYCSILATQMSAYTEIQQKKVKYKENKIINIVIVERSELIWYMILKLNTILVSFYTIAVMYTQWYTLITFSLEPGIYIQR